MTQTDAVDALTTREKPTLASIVVPLCNEAGNIGPLVAAIDQALPGQNYELILVDDGSTDATFQQVAELAESDSHIVGVSLSRNFGHQYALAAGLSLARGQVIISMDGDMQHPPDLLGVLIEKWCQGYNVVQALRQDTEQIGLFKRLTSRAFYRVFSALCGIPIDSGASDFRLIDRMVLDELLAMKEGALFLRGLLAWMGYQRAVVPFTVGNRLSGRSKYTLRRMLHLAGNGLFSFSTIPLRIGIILGMITGVLALMELVYALVVYLLGHTAPGWTSTIAVISLLFAILFLILGIQGEYLIRIYQRIQLRPPFIIERVVSRRARPQKSPESQRGQ